MVSKCHACNKKAAIKIKLGNSKDKRNMCMEHYTVYMNAGKEHKVVFKRANEV